MRGARVLKVFAWIVGILVVLVIAGLVALRFVLPPEKLRAMVLPRIEQALGQSVEVGSVHLAIWGGFGVGVEDVRIGNRPGYEDEHMLVLDELVLRIPLRPLLSRRLEVTKVALVRPQIFVEKSAEGTVNVAGLGRRLSPPPEAEVETPAEPPSPPISLPIPVTLKSFEIEGGWVRYSDAAAGFAADIGGIDHRASFSVDRALTDARAEGRLSAERVVVRFPGLPEPLPPFGVRVTHRVRADLAHSILTLDQVQVTVMDAAIDVRGTVEDFVDPVLHLQMETSTNLAQLPTAEKVRISGSVSLKVRAEGPALRPERMTLDGQVRVGGVTIEAETLPVPIRGLSAEINLSGQDIAIPKLTGALGSSPFSLRCDVNGAVPFAATGGKIPPTVRFALDCPHLVLDELLPAEDAAQAPAAPPVVAGPAADRPEPSPLPPIPEMNATGALTIQRITARKLEARDLKVRIEMAGAEVRVPVFEVGVYSGRILGSAEAALKDSVTVPFSVSVRARGVQANDFVSALTPFEGHLFGRLDLDAEFAGAGPGPDRIRQTLTGKGHASVAEGRLVNWDFARRVSRWIKFLEFEDVDFKNLDLDFAVADQRVDMRPLKLKALDTRWAATGSVGFDASLDYRVTARLSSAMTESLKNRTSLGGRLTTDIGETELVFRVTGPARAPEFRWETEGLEARAQDRARQEVRDFVEEHRDEAAEAIGREVEKRLGGEAGERARDLVEGILRPDTTDTTGEARSLEDLKEEGENLLRDLLKKKPKK